jgi:hypothetical protein
MLEVVVTDHQGKEMAKLCAGHSDSSVQFFSESIRPWFFDKQTRYIASATEHRFEVRSAIHDWYLEIPKS